MIVIRNIEQLYELTGLASTDYLHFRRPGASGNTKDYKISVVNFANALAQSLDTDIDQLSLDVSSSTIIVDFSDSNVRNYTGSVAISGDRIWNFTNDDNALSLVVFVQISTIGDHTLPNSVKMQSWIDSDTWDGDNFVWTPQETGIYELRFDWSGSYWLLKISGSF